MNLDKAFYCTLTIYQKQRVPSGDLTFQGKIGSIDQHMLQKLIFFSVWLFIGQRGCFIAGTARTRGHSDTADTEHSQLPDCELLSWEGLRTQITHRHTQLIPGLTLIHLETLWGFKGRCSAGKTHSTGTLEFHSHWKAALRELSFLVPEHQQSPQFSARTGCVQEQNKYFSALVNKLFATYLGVLEREGKVWPYDHATLSCSLAPGPAHRSAWFVQQALPLPQPPVCGTYSLTAPSIQEECPRRRGKGRPRVPCFHPSCAASTELCCQPLRSHLAQGKGSGTTTAEDKTAAFRTLPQSHHSPICLCYICSHSSYSVWTATVLLWLCLSQPLPSQAWAEEDRAKGIQRYSI